MAELLFLVLLVVPAAGDEKKPARLDAPDGGAQRRAETEIKDLLKAEYAAARKSAEAGQPLAKKLLQYGTEEKSNAGQRYVCFRESRDVAAKAGDFNTAIAAIEAMAASFEVDALEMKRAALETARRAIRSGEGLRGVARAYPELLDQAVASDRYDLAGKLASDFASAAERAKEELLTAEANARKKDVREIKAEFDRVADERASIAEGKVDSRAALAVGRFLCVMKEAWEAGLPLLAKGADAESNAIAERETAKPDGAAAQVDLGDRWWSAAAGEPGPMKVRMQRRAAHWYGRALPRLEGLARARVERLLEEYEDAAEKAGLPGRTVYLSDMKVEDHFVGFGVLGRDGKLGYLIAQKPALSRVTVHGKELFHTLSPHPPSNGKSRIAFDLEGEYRTLVSEVALVDGDGTPSRSPLIFRVLGDGKILWTSQPISRPKVVEKLKVPLSGVRRLALEIECPGSNSYATGLWVEPRVLR